MAMGKKGTREMTTFTTQDRQDAERATLGNELVNLVKNHLRHSLCSGSISIQSRVYLDDVEISNIRQEKPKSKPLTLTGIELLIRPLLEARFKMNDTLPNFDYIAFARAIERAHGIGE
jgi:hypothetical protein